MSQPTPKMPLFVVCPNCGAQNYSKAKECWICFRTLPTEPIVMATIVAPPDFIAGRWFQVMTSAMSVILLCITFAFSIIFHHQLYTRVFGGLAIATAITTVLIGARQGNVRNAVWSLFLSAVIAMAVCILLCIAAIIFLCAICFSAISGGGLR